MGFETLDEDRRTELVPTTTMEEVPILSAQERAALAKSLADAEERIKAGDFVTYDPRTFQDRLRKFYEAAKQADKA